jgi:NAD(P)H-dependent FMN reductase
VPEARSAKLPLQARGTGLALEVSVFQPLIGIVTTSTREQRFGEKAAQWIHRIAVQRNDLRFEIVDLRDYELPFFDGVSPLWAPVENPVAIRWAKKMAELDGYLFVTAEYNHSVTGVFKNALDWAYREYNRKPAAYLGYGALGAGRAVEHLRLINVELQMAPTRSAVHVAGADFMGLFTGTKSFEEMPHLARSADLMLNELAWWTAALKVARERDGIVTAAA